MLLPTQFLLTPMHMVFKAGFHMIADDRRRSQRELFSCNRRWSQPIAEPTVAIDFVQRKCQIYTRVVLARKSKQTTWRISRGKFCCNLFLLLVLKRRQRQLQNRRKHRFWLRKIFMKGHDTLNFSPAITITGSQTIAEGCFHMIAELSAIRDRLRSYGNQP